MNAIDVSGIMLAAGAANQPGGGGGGGLPSMLVPMVLIFGIFYFMLIRPQQRKEKDRKAMIAAIKSGDRVMFGGGILGQVANVKDSTFVIKIADNVKVEVARGAVSRVLDKGEKAPETADADA
jgi:preprotein translocase subunit YajC